VTVLTAIIGATTRRQANLSDAARALNGSPAPQVLRDPESSSDRTRPVGERSKVPEEAPGVRVIGVI
jgi:hypothetical protein